MPPGRSSFPRRRRSASCGGESSLRSLKFARLVAAASPVSKSERPGAPSFGIVAVIVAARPQGAGIPARSGNEEEHVFSLTGLTPL